MSAAVLPQWSVVGKNELMQHFGDWVKELRVSLPALRTFIADPCRIGEPFLGEYVVWDGSGSSGEPAGSARGLAPATPWVGRNYA